MSTKPWKRPDAEKRDPRSEYYVPNDYANRRGRDDSSPVEEGPPYTFDAAAIVHQSELNPAPRRDPLEAAEILADLTAMQGFDRERWFCARCYRWTRRASFEDKSRKAHIGGGDTVTYTHDPDNCNGCLFSHLDGSGENLREVRDRLFNEWTNLRAKLDQAEEAGRIAQSPADKRDAKTERKRLRDLLETARGACNLAGFDPAKRRRSLARGSGDAPELADHHDRSREFKVDRGRDAGPHWRHSPPGDERKRA